MRWRDQAPPEFGDSRIVSAFLWLPLTIRLETRWLERATWMEMHKHGEWNPLRWIDEPEASSRKAQ